MREREILGCDFGFSLQSAFCPRERCKTAELYDSGAIVIPLLAFAPDKPRNCKIVVGGESETPQLCFILQTVSNRIRHILGLFLNARIFVFLLICLRLCDLVLVSRSRITQHGTHLFRDSVCSKLLVSINT